MHIQLWKYVRVCGISGLVATVCGTLSRVVYRISVTCDCRIAVGIGVYTPNGTFGRLLCCKTELGSRACVVYIETTLILYCIASVSSGECEAGALYCFNLFPVHICSCLCREVSVILFSEEECRSAVRCKECVSLACSNLLSRDVWHCT